MIILLSIILFGAIAMVVYAIYSITISGSRTRTKHKKTSLGILEEKDTNYEEQKVDRLQGQITVLETELDKVRADYANIQKELDAARKTESQLKEELTRRQDWVAKAEEMLNKTKEENLNLQSKFVAKEKDLEQEFAKNVNGSKEIRGLKEKTALLEKDNKDKADKIETQRHKIERLNKDLEGLQETIAEFKKKEQISEWVPKQEFNRLNEEYTELEKDLEVKEEKLKSFAQELMQLRNQLPKKEPAVEVAEQPKKLVPTEGEVAEQLEKTSAEKSGSEAAAKDTLSTSNTQKESIENQKSAPEEDNEEKRE
jgi:chromosome segregation ATPase